MHLQGAATQTSSSGPNANLVATLPAIIAPTRTVYTIVETNSGTYADLAITPSGQILVIAPHLPVTEDLGFLSLDAITYQPSATAGPHGFSLTRKGDVLALLHKPRALELIVFELGPRAHLLGAVKLGRHPAGRSRIHWDLRVAGHRLGAYTPSLPPCLLTASPAAGRASGSRSSAITGCAFCPRHARSLLRPRTAAEDHPGA